MALSLFRPEFSLTVAHDHPCQLVAKKFNNQVVMPRVKTDTKKDFNTTPSKGGVQKPNKQKAEGAQDKVRTKVAKATGKDVSDLTPVRDLVAEYVSPFSLCVFDAFEPFSDRIQTEDSSKPIAWQGFHWKSAFHCQRRYSCFETVFCRHRYVFVLFLITVNFH